MIERITVTGEATNKYFIHNDKLAKTWEDLAVRYHGKISGQVNSQILELDLTFEWDQKQITVKVLRQISNKNTAHSTGLLMTRNTQIEITPFHHNNPNWVIYKSNMFQDLYHKLIGESKVLDYDSTFTIASNQWIIEHEIISEMEFRTMMRLAELRKIQYKNSILKIEYNNYIGADSILDLFNDILN